MVAYVNDGELMYFTFFTIYLFLRNDTAMSHVLFICNCTKVMCSYFTSHLNCSLTCPSFLPLTTLFSNNNGFSMRGFKWKSMKQRRHVVQRCEDFGCGRKLVADGVD